MVEDIKGYRLLDIPEKLIERYHPQDVKDIYEGMTGFEFIYTLVSLGLSVEQQSKIIDLVDGRGMFSSSRKMNIKWRDMRGLISDLRDNPNTKSLLGNQLSEQLTKL